MSKSDEDTRQRKSYQFSKRLQRSNDIQKNFREDSRNLEFQDIFVLSENF